MDELRGQLIRRGSGTAGVLRGAGRLRSRRWLTTLAALGALACAETPQHDDEGAVVSVARAPAIATAPSRPASVVDSILPPEEEMRRFREGLPEVRALTEGAPSRDELVVRFVRAVEEADTAAFAPLLLNRAEFAWLYYPHSMFVRPPYRQAPALVWFQMQSNSDRTLTRVFSRLAGAPLHVSGYACESEPAAEGPNRIWRECRLTLTPPGADPFVTRLFGSILERDGVFKFVSFASDL